MKKLYIISWLVFCIGLWFKLLHWPGSNIIQILGCFSLLVHAFIFFVKHVRNDLAKSLKYLSFAGLTVYFLFRMMYWHAGPFILGFPVLLFLVLLIAFLYLGKSLKQEAKLKTPQFILLLYMACIFVLSFTHSHTIYYFFNLNPSLHSESYKSNFYAWDKYSWFLYISNEKEKALEANKNAEKAFLSKSDYYDYSALNFTIELIRQHKQEIEDGTWKTYR